MEEPKKFQCDYPDCNASFAKNSKLVIHARLHGNERPFKCEESGCERTYTNSSHLKRHIQSVHIKVKSYACKICSLKVATSTNLKKHMLRIHPDGKSEKHKCKVCSQVFYKKHQLKEHLSYYHDGVASYKCGKCDKSFVRARDFEKHQKRHTKYNCQCGQVKDTWTDLLAHMRIDHKKEHKCDVCQKTFAAKCRLNSHMKLVHNEEKNMYLCPEDGCGRLYIYKRNLTQHLATVHSGAGHKCPECDQTLSSKQKLNQHIKSIHAKTKTVKKKKKPQAVRKDVGTIKRSSAVKLAGLAGQIPLTLETKVINGEKLDIENILEIPYISDTESILSDRSKRSDHSDAGSQRQLLAI